MFTQIVSRRAALNFTYDLLSVKVSAIVIFKFKVHYKNLKVDIVLEGEVTGYMF